MKYSQHFSTRQTPQNEPIPGSNQQMNNAGGYSFTIDPWQRLDRFLVLGSDKGTYYVNEKRLTVDNANNVLQCIKEDGQRVVARVVLVSEAGRAPKNDPALFVLALCIKFGDKETVGLAYRAIPRVARTGTHLFTLMENLKVLGKNSMGLRKALAQWYNGKSAENLAYQLVKYRQRNGWSHKDVLILSHPTPVDRIHSILYNWAVNNPPVDDYIPSNVDPQFAPLNLTWAYEMAQRAESEGQIRSLILEYNLPWEAIDPKWLGSAKVWEALLPGLPITATIRNLGRMTANGLLSPMSSVTKTVIERITDAERLKKGRVHPIAVLAALVTYQQGHGFRGSLTWSPVGQVVDALNAAFYVAFGAVEPAGKRLMLALDVSRSMGSGEIAGIPGMTPRVGSAAMALVTAATEPMYEIMAFSTEFKRLDISPKQRLDDVVVRMSRMPFGGTDCALPMLYAMKNNVPVDAFVVYCVDTKTEILTASGWKHYNDVRVGEEVYTLNHESGLGEWQPATAINVFPSVTRPMILLEGRGHSSLTTPNHRWPVRWRGNSHWGRRWKTTETLNSVDYVQCAARDGGLPAEPVYDDAFVELVAWAWTEGCWNNSDALSICQSSKNVHGCERIRTCLQELFGPPCEGSMYPYRLEEKPLWTEDAPRESNGVIYWRINQAGSVPFLKVMDIDSKAVFNNWLRELTLEQLNLFIDTSMAADGNCAKGRLAQSVPTRAEAFAFACILAGRSVSYVPGNNAHHVGYLEIGLLSRYQFAPIQNVTNKDDRPFKMEQVEYTGEVWCPTTPNGTWLARRNGSVYWTGNTDSETWYGQVHPAQALKMYRQKTGIAAKLVVVGMTATEFSIGDSADGGCLDVIGFDTASPSLISDFVADRA